MNKIEFSNKELIIDGVKFDLAHTIRDARIIENLAVVIFKFTDEIPRHRQFNNCQAFDRNGKLIWTAEHPTNTTADFYVEFMDSKKNKLWNFGCFVCELDFKNGKLIKAVFTK